MLGNHHHHHLNRATKLENTRASYNDILNSLYVINEEAAAATARETSELNLNSRRIQMAPRASICVSRLNQQQQESSRHVTKTLLFVSFTFLILNSPMRIYMILKFFKENSNSNAHSSLSPSPSPSPSPAPPSLSSMMALMITMSLYFSSYSVNFFL